MQLDNNLQKDDIFQTEKYLFEMVLNCLKSYQR